MLLLLCITVKSHFACANSCLGGGDSRSSPCMSPWFALYTITPKLKGSWEKRIIDRVHNIRSTSSRKRASTDDIEGTPTKRGRPKGSSLLNRYPPVPDSDNDTVSNERNLIALKKEMEKEKPRKDVILSLLHQTFQIRRDEILSDRNEVSVSSILSSYKALSLPYAVSKLQLLALSPFGLKVALSFVLYM